jgi:Protein kinase domain
MLGNFIISPEVWKDLPYDIKSDIWSLGCVLYEVTMLFPPFRANDMSGLYKKVLKGLYPKISSHYSNDLANMIKMLLQVAPINRPNCDKILKTPIITNKAAYIFPNEDIQSDTPNKLLKTIKIPKNLLYLTDKLPKPNYDRESNRRRTSNVTSCYLPVIKSKAPSNSFIYRKRHSPKKISLKVKNIDVNSIIEKKGVEKLKSDKTVETPGISNEISKDVKKIDEERKKIKSLIKPIIKVPSSMKKHYGQEDTKETEEASINEIPVGSPNDNDTTKLLVPIKHSINKKLDSILKEFGINIPKNDKNGKIHAVQLFRSPYINSVLNNPLKKKKLCAIPHYSPSKDSSSIEKGNCDISADSPPLKSVDRSKSKASLPIKDL